MSTGDARLRFQEAFCSFDDILTRRGSLFRTLLNRVEKPSVKLEAHLMEPAFPSLLPSDVRQALRGIWKQDEEMFVIEGDQERHVLMASTYGGEPPDARPVIQKGVQFRAFRTHRNGGSDA